MDNAEIVYNGLHQYFNVLEQVGRYKQSTAYRLVIYAFLVKHVFDGALQEYVNDADLPVINSLLRCLDRDSCIITRLPCSVNRKRPRDMYVHELRITQSSALRSTEKEQLREAE